MKYAPSISSLYLGSHFFHLLTSPRFGALNLPEVNKFTGNCFRMVRIVLKITFLKLRYPKGVTGRLPLCPIMALDMEYVEFMCRTIQILISNWPQTQKFSQLLTVAGREDSCYYWLLSPWSRSSPIFMLLACTQTFIFFIFIFSSFSKTSASVRGRARARKKNEERL